jgi:hypothetical protein
VGVEGVTWGGSQGGSRRRAVTTMMTTPQEAQNKKQTTLLEALHDACRHAQLTATWHTSTLCPQRTPNNAFMSSPHQLHIITESALNSCVRRC